MRLLLTLLIIISVTPWAYPQVGNTAEHWISGNDNISTTTQTGNITNQTQKGQANFAISTIFGNGNNSTIVQH